MISGSQSATDRANEKGCVDSASNQWPQRVMFRYSYAALGSLRWRLGHSGAQVVYYGEKDSIGPLAFLPRCQTASIFSVFDMSSNGLAVRMMKSASLPGRSAPRSVSPRSSAARPVAHVSA